MASRLQVIKRYRMERTLCGTLPAATLPTGFRLVPWDDRLLDHHADVLARCFPDGSDGRLFPCLRSAAGCRALIQAIRTHPGFCDVATWLAVGRAGCAGTVQALMGEHRVAAIQNLGVAPEHRGAGVGGALLAAALAGLRDASATRVWLEVTASNKPAVRLYRRFGFRQSGQLYRAAPRSEVAFADAPV